MTFFSVSGKKPKDLIEPEEEGKTTANWLFLQRYKISFFGSKLRFPQSKLDSDANAALIPRPQVD